MVILYTMSPYIVILYTMSPYIVILYTMSPYMVILYTRSPYIVILYTMSPYIVILYTMSPYMVILYTRSPYIVILLHLIIAIYSPHEALVSGKGRARVFFLGTSSCAPLDCTCGPKWRLRHMNGGQEIYTPLVHPTSCKQRTI